MVQIILADWVTYFYLAVLAMAGMAALYGRKSSQRSPQGPPQRPPWVRKHLYSNSGADIGVGDTHVVLTRSK